MSPQWLAAMCSFGSASEELGSWEEYDTTEPPCVLNDERCRAESEDLVSALSSLAKPLVVGREEATANVSALPAAAQQASRSSSFGVYRRLRSITPQQQAEEPPGLEWTESRKILEVAIATEQQSPPIDYRQDMAAQERRLLSRLHSLGLDMHVQCGDGNCQFRSLSFCLHGTPVHHARVRASAVQYMRQYRSQFEAFLGQDFGAYIKEMAKAGVWGDELTLRAVCESYGMVINVVTSDPENWFMRYIPSHALVRHEAFLSYISPVHYNAIRRRRKGVAPALRSLSSLGRRNSRLLAALDQYEALRAVPETPQALMQQVATGG